MRTARRAMIAAAAAVGAASAAGAQDVAVRTLVDRFEAARLRYDPVALSATLAPDYEEISPIGNVDPRDRVLGFYAPKLKTAAPPMTEDQVTVRTTGDLALVTLRQSFTIPGAAPRSIRVRYVARRAGGAWRLVSAQYTPIPPSKAR